MTTPHLNNTVLFRSQLSWWAGRYLLIYMVINSTSAPRVRQTIAGKP